MSKETNGINFKKDDVIECRGNFFQVESNEGSKGTVWELDSDGEIRTGVLIEKFSWEDCVKVNG